MVRVGVLGGTFDPPHMGHIAIAEEARCRLDLSYVLLVPAGQPWLKSERHVSAAADRFEMVRLAIASHPYFRLSSMEIDRAGPSYTVETLARLKADLGAESDLFFLMGWDSLDQLPRWREAARVIELCRLVAVPRPGYPRPDLAELEAEIPGISERVVYLDMPPIDISATEIRERVARGEPIADLVPQAVERYIRERGLYRG